MNLTLTANDEKHLREKWYTIDVRYETERLKPHYPKASAKEIRQTISEFLFDLELEREEADGGQLEINLLHQLVNKTNPKVLVPKDNNSPYRHQKLAKEKILSVLLDRRLAWAHLHGKCRSGKLGTIFSSFFGWTEENLKKSPGTPHLLVHILCQSNLAGKRDAISEMEKCLGNLENFDAKSLNKIVALANNMGNLDLNKYRSTVNTVILHQPDLLNGKADKITALITSILQMGGKVMVSLDECDSYVNNDGHIKSFLKMNGVFLNKLDTISPSLTVLSTSATAFAYLAKAQSRQEDEELWRRASPHIVCLQAELASQNNGIGYNDLAYLKQEGRILQIEDLFKRNEHGKPIAPSPWFIDRLNEDCGTDLWNIMRFGKYELPILDEMEKDPDKFGLRPLKLWRCYSEALIATDGGVTGQMLDYMADIPLDSSKEINLLIGKHFWDRTVAGPYEKIGVLFEPRRSANTSTDWQRSMRSVGWFNLKSTRLKMYTDLKDINRIIKAEASMDDYYDGKTQDIPILLKSNHFSGNTVQRRVSYETSFQKVPTGRELDTYARLPKKQGGLERGVDRAHKQKGKAGHCFYESVLTPNGNQSMLDGKIVSQHGIQRSGRSLGNEARITDFLQPPHPDAGIQRKQNYDLLLDTFKNPDAALTLQALGDMEIDFLELQDMIETSVKTGKSLFYLDINLHDEKVEESYKTPLEKDNISHKHGLSDEDN